MPKKAFLLGWNRGIKDLLCRERLAAVSWDDTVPEAISYFKSQCDAFYLTCIKVLSCFYNSYFIYIWYYQVVTQKGTEVRKFNSQMRLGIFQRLWDVIVCMWLDLGRKSRFVVNEFGASHIPRAHADWVSATYPWVVACSELKIPSSGICVLVLCSRVESFGRRIFRRGAPHFNFSDVWNS